MTQEQLKTRHVGKQDPKRHLENAVETAMGDQVRPWLILYLSTIAQLLSIMPHSCSGMALQISSSSLHVP
jgi:hypothetical protein